ncbi:MAG TPA: amidase domain-containing protein [Candidatus Saccharimonas sp.]|nr:amidase domain-containing protein [Candidatus Saccharimonas sp.]
MKRTMRRLLTGVVVALALSAVGADLQAAPADAQTRPIVIVNNAHIRPSPDTSQNWLTTMPAGSRPQYICYVDGENEGGTTKWFRVSWNGVTGYYSSVADDMPLALQTNIEGNYGIPRCGSGADLQPAGGSGLQPAGGAGINQESGAGVAVAVQPEQQVTEPYNRAAAVQWALNHVQDIRGNLFADCTWFVSQALWAGGLHQTSWWNDYERRQGSVLSQPGTDVARGAPNLVKYLQQRFPVTVTPLDGNRFRDNRVPEAQPGDIIAYDWDSDSTFDHLAFVVDIAPGQYPEVSEWGTFPVREPYNKRGWTWSELSHKWLQQEYPRQPDGLGGVTAELLHFNLPG